MSAPTPKRGRALFTQCDKCGAEFMDKHREQHSADCPPNLKNPTYNFAKDGVLYGNLDAKTNEDIQGVTGKEFMVFLSQAAMQLCSLAIGQWAQIHFGGSAPPVAKVAFPTTEQSSTSVLMTKACLELCPVGVHSTVRVSKLDKGTVPDARCATVGLLKASKKIEVTPELIGRVHKYCLKKIFCAGNRFGFVYYGQMVKFEVEALEGESEGLEESFSTLSTEERMFRIVDRTCVKFSGNQPETDDSPPIEKRDLLQQIGGLDDEIDELRTSIAACLNKSPKIANLPRGRSVLLHGHSGTGKTSVATALAEESKANVITISAPILYGRTSDQSPEEVIQNLFKEATEKAPSVIILDEVDVLCPSRSSRMTDSERRVVSTLLMMLDALGADTSSKRVFVMATTNKPDSIDPAFRRYGRLDREMEIPTPNPKGRGEILGRILRGVSVDWGEGGLEEVALSTHGFVGADLAALCARAGLRATGRGATSLRMEDFKFALKHVRPSAMREVQIEVANVKWSDIGGQSDLKLALKQAVEWPLRHPESFSRLGITPPRGVLMFGPPGCSKTMIAKALATESKLNFLSVKGSELFSKWVGESEKAVRDVFRKARQVAPSVIFFDEIDALGGERGSGGSSTSVQERVLAQLLTEMDGVSPLGDVTVLAATNRPDKIDRALLRPGRLDRIIYVPLPDEETRKEIFRLKTSKMPISGVDIDDLVAKTGGYSGAEVNAVCHEAAMAALEESLEAENVEGGHFEKALRKIRPRTPAYLIKLYEDYVNEKI